MGKPLVVSIDVPNRAQAKGIVTAAEGLEVRVSLLPKAGERLDRPRRMRRGQRLKITFCSEKYGNTPPIESELLGVSRAESAHELTCEVVDWPSLAEYWARVLQASSATASSRNAADRRRQRSGSQRPRS